MVGDNEGNNSFLMELYRRTEGDTELQVSMHDIGEAIGLGKSETGALAETLMVEELVELKTLAGGITITANGLEYLSNKGMIAEGTRNVLLLSGEPVLTVEDQNVVREITGEIKEAITGARGDYTTIEELVVDMKTMEVQLLSPKAKTSIILAILGSLQQNLQSMGIAEMAEKLEGLLN